MTFPVCEPCAGRLWVWMTFPVCGPCTGGLWVFMKIFSVCRTCILGNFEFLWIFSLCVALYLETLSFYENFPVCGPCTGETLSFSKFICVCKGLVSGDCEKSLTSSMCMIRCLRLCVWKRLLVCGPCTERLPLEYGSTALNMRQTMWKKWPLYRSNGKSFDSDSFCAVYIIEPTPLELPIIFSYHL